MNSRYPKVKTIFNTSGYCPGYHHAKNLKEIKFIRDVFKQLKIPTKLKKIYGTSDANSLNSKGLKVVTLADGVINPHTTQEKTSLENLEKMKKIISVLLALRVQSKRGQPFFI